MAKHNEIGKQGEDKAVEYLMQQGYVILERNWRLGHLELDIICRTQNLLVIVEVKTRKDDVDKLEDLLSWRKRRNLLRAADAYAKKNQLNMEIRFDLLLVTGESMDVEHIQEAVSILD